MAAIFFYCDESGKYRKNPVITLSGIGARSERLSKFNREWTALLRSYGLDELHMSKVAQLTQACGPKMPSGQNLEARTQALLPFADCINDHLEIGLLQAWDVKGYNQLSLEVKRQLGGSHDPHQLAFIRGLLEVASHLGDADTISIVADDDELTAWNTYLHYRAIAKAEPNLEKQLAAITFAKSHYYTPLQAADMVAFLARREATEKFWGMPNDFTILFHYLMRGPRSSSTGGIMQWFYGFYDEQKLVDLANAVMETKNGKREKTEG